MSLITPGYNLQVRRVPLKNGPNAVARGPETRLVVVQAEGENPVKQALGAVRKALRWVINGPAVSQFKSFKTYDDPDTRWASGEELRAAQANLTSRSGAESAAIARLGARAESYRVLAGLCGQDPMAREALMKMLLDGRLAKKDLAGGGDMLDHLAKLATGPLATGLDRKDLVSNLIEEAENPVKIAQEGKGTCVATSSTIYLARKNASEYVRLVAELARPEGTARAAGGETLVRNADWANDNDYGRTPSVRLLQPALMDLGNGFLRYNNAKDFHTLEAAEPTLWQKVKDFLANVPLLPGGLSGRGANKVLEALTGEEFAMTYMVTRLNRESTFKKVEAAVKAGKTVPVGLEWEGGGHKVLLDKIEGGLAYITNPWGEKDTLSVEEFKSNLMDANIPKR